MEAYLACEIQDNGTSTCRPHKREILQDTIDTTKPGLERRNAIVASLQSMGVRVFVIEGATIKNTQEIIDHIRRIVGFVARENRIHAKTGPLGYQRCLLYQDKDGRLFNLVLSKHAIGPAGRWEELLDIFSGKEAMIALTVLCRSFPCATEGTNSDWVKAQFSIRSPSRRRLTFTLPLSTITGRVLNTFKPAYLSLVLGLVLTEEISMSWLNASMLVRGAPSVAAHSLVSPIGADLLRKGLVLSLALAGAATGQMQIVLTLLGISGACIVLLANLGCRAWHFLGWKPQRYHGLSASLVAYFAAIATGIVFPYMGHRDIEVGGGKAAMEYVIKTALTVAVIFVISDFDEVHVNIGGYSYYLSCVYQLGRRTNR